MSTQLLIVYYAFFHNIGMYGIIAWRATYDNTFCHIQKIWARLFKIINKKSESVILPSKIEQCYILEALTNNYNILSNEFMMSTNKTRNKIPLLITNKTLTQKSSKTIAIKTFIKLPAQLKTLKNSEKITQTN